MPLFLRRRRCCFRRCVVLVLVATAADDEPPRRNGSGKWASVEATNSPMTSKEDRETALIRCFLMARLGFLNNSDTSPLGALELIYDLRSPIILMTNQSD
mmetsp:Transcript_25131/g.52953  ORF Transcript_25131/g.52953 Transcript_25131/m.52953 type:complete len:100 (-) Transcript_25131:82-381(-)